MNLQGTLVIIPQEELDQLKSVQLEILSLLKSIQGAKTGIVIKNIPA